MLSYNRRAIRAYEQCGFVHEGVVRECRCVDDEWIDDLRMSILDREYHRIAEARRKDDAHDGEVQRGAGRRSRQSKAGN